MFKCPILISVKCLEVLSFRLSVEGVLQSLGLRFRVVLVSLHTYGVPWRYAFYNLSLFGKLQYNIELKSLRMAALSLASKEGTSMNRGGAFVCKLLI